MVPSGQRVVAVGHADRKGFRQFQQPQHLRHAARIFRVARKFRLVDQLAAHKILAVADDAAQRRIGRQQQRAVQLELLHHRLDFGRHLPAQNRIHFLVNPFARRPRATVSPPPPRVCPRLPRSHERESVSTQTRSARPLGLPLRTISARKPWRNPTAPSSAAPVKSSAMTPIIFYLRFAIYG